MERKISLQFLLISLLSSVLAAVICCFAFYGVMSRQVFSDLKMTAQAVAENIGDTDKLAALDTRVTLISSDGSVLYDNSADFSEMDNHLNRDEVKQAFEKGSGTALRNSATLGEKIYYYAQKLSDNTVLRVSVKSVGIQSVFYSMMPVILIALIVIFALCAFLSAALTKNIVKPIKSISETIESADLDDFGYEELVPLIRKIKSQRHQIEQQLSRVKSEKEKITAIMQHMSEGLILFDAAKNAVLINETAMTLLKTSDDAIGERIYYITRDSEIIDCVRKAENGGTASGMFKLGGRNYQFTASPVLFSGEQKGVVCLIIDVTEKTGLEKMRREFTANVSHELKTPLTSVMGYSELIESGIAKTEDIPKFAEKIGKEASRMLALISDILNLSKLDELNEPDDVASVNLKKIAEETAENLSLLADEYGVELSVSGDETFVEGSAGKLTELVYNLCENAIRYNKPSGSVRIEIKGKKLIVSDTGIGIAKDKQQRVFERFYRVDKSRSKESGGTGLGLAIVKHIAAQHGAKIELESEENKGTTITVTFK